MDNFQKIQKTLFLIEDDWSKFKNKGNASAGRRVRKALMQVKNLAHDLRLEILNGTN